MKAIPTTGIAQGIKFLEKNSPANLKTGPDGQLPVVICSLGDASMTEGEVSEALQFAALKQLPIIYLVQDNGWGISVTSDEARSMDAYRFARGFKGLNRESVDGSNFSESFRVMKKVVDQVRAKREPYIVHATVPLLGHQTSGVRKEFYRSNEDLIAHETNDPGVKLKKKLIALGFTEEELNTIQSDSDDYIAEQFSRAVDAPEPTKESITDHIFFPTPVTEKKGQKSPADKNQILIVKPAPFSL